MVNKHTTVPHLIASGRNAQQRACGAAPDGGIMEEFPSLL